MSQLPETNDSQQCRACGKSFKRLKLHWAKSGGPCGLLHHQQILDDNRSAPVRIVNENIPDTTQPHTPETSDIQAVHSQCDDFRQIFENMYNGGTSENDFSAAVRDFQTFLFQSNRALPGPKHPATSYYRRRKNMESVQNDIGYSKTSNPQLASSKRRQRNREKYYYDLAQYNYYNRRSKVAKQILNGAGQSRLKAKIEQTEEYFRNIFEQTNDNVRTSYEHCPDQPPNHVVAADDISDSLKGMSLDASPGPDGVLVRTAKELPISRTLAYIANIMLSTGYVPECFKLGRTVLIEKQGSNGEELRNRRPITIFPLLRRIIERTFDRVIRAHCRFSWFQRGFDTVPGTHINTTIVDGCLRSARRERKDICVAFLDVTKAFDTIGHEHIKRTLFSLPIPGNLRNILVNLVSSNTTKIESNRAISRAIRLLRGVPQGSPVSPTIFNLVIDFVLKEAGDHEIAQEYGYTLTPDLENLSVLGFADDTAVIGRDQLSCSRLIDIVRRGLSTIGLDVNSTKSAVINIKDGKLRNSPIHLADGNNIKSISDNERIKYLGVTFKDEIVFDKESFLSALITDLQNLTVSPLLKADQKLNILDKYIWPTLVYPLQCAPVAGLPATFLERVDQLLRKAVKEIAELPSDVPNGMLYAPRKLRGLAILRVSWEAYLQKFAIARSLKFVDDDHLHHIRDFDAEMTRSRNALGVEGHTPRMLRSQLREGAFSEWCSKPQRGLGVSSYRDCPKTNKWITSKSGLSCSEWRQAIKMNCSSIATNATPGRSQSGPLCRHTNCTEYETLPHVLGKCPRSEGLRNLRHHRVRTAVANLFREKSFEVYEEVHCVSSDGSNRRADIIILSREHDRALIIDPTVRFENNDNLQPQNVDEEKRQIYAPCANYLREKYNVSNWEVAGLLFGARGTASHFLIQFFQFHDLPLKQLTSICLDVMRDSLGIIHNHLYSHISNISV